MDLSKTVSFHVDVDSPILLSRFYGNSAIGYDLKSLESFYENTFRRAFSLFDEFGIKATFFCVGEEIVKSPLIANLLKEACDKGHAIANHTFSHPFGMNTLSNDEIENEIVKCNEAIKNAIGHYPVGFRAPGYAIDTNVINILEKKGILYDSSAGWPVFHILLKGMAMLRRINKNIKMDVGYGETNSFFRKLPYTPSEHNWKKVSDKKRKIKQFPLPTSFQLLPYYCNFHLSLPSYLRNIFLKNVDNSHLVYLFHIIEFASVHDEFIPKNIARHPNIQIEFEKKNILFKSFLAQLLKGRHSILTEKYIADEPF